MGGLNSNKTLNQQNIESSFPQLILLQLIYLNYDMAGKGLSPRQTELQKLLAK